MKRILIVDNQDSFVYNLVQLVREAKESCLFDVVRSEQLVPNMAERYDGLMLSPGPGLPDDEPRLMHTLMDFIRLAKPILGICLGCQAIALAFGYPLTRLERPLHGHASHLYFTPDLLFMGLEQGCAIARYHSWVVDLSAIPNGSEGALLELGYSEDIDGRQTMALRHQSLPIWGLQFHPESMITEGGAHYIDNWLSIL